MNESLKWTLLGILTIVFGIVVLGNTIVASLAITTLTGALMLAGGIFQFIGGLSVEGMGNKVFAWVTGALMAFLGWSFLAHPLAGMVTLSTLILILLAAGGIARIIFSFRMRGTGLFLPMLISGILSLGLAVFIWGNPAATVQLLGMLLGIEMLFNGFGMVFAGMFVRKTEG
jgi:uncharacterized membrane protein HdeD (DUF308 family)